MNRKRKTHRGLPSRVYLKHGAYRFNAPEPMRHPKTGKMQSSLHLAYEYEGEAAMYATLALLLNDRKSLAGSMPQVCSDYKTRKLAKYGDETQKTYTSYLDLIADDFEEYYVSQVTTKDCAQFIRNHYADKANTANKVAALMKRLFKYAIGELGLRADNPMDQLDLSDYETVRREVLPTHAQIEAIRSAGMTSKPDKRTGTSFKLASGEMFGCIIDMSYLLWQRAIDIRLLKEEQILDKVIRFKPRKTKGSSGKQVDILITPQIQAVIDRARSVKTRYKLISPFLFPKTRGGAYTKSGLFSMWDRARERAGITDDVMFKDIRALAATDAAKGGNAKEELRKRLAHTSTDTSEIYIKEAVPETSSIDMKLPW